MIYGGLLAKNIKNMKIHMLYLSLLYPLKCGNAKNSGMTLTNPFLSFFQYVSAGSDRLLFTLLPYHFRGKKPMLPSEEEGVGAPDPVLTHW
jgi:hypothetical protein